MIFSKLNDDLFIRNHWWFPKIYKKICLMPRSQSRKKKSMKVRWGNFKESTVQLSWILMTARYRFFFKLKSQAYFNQNSKQLKVSMGFEKFFWSFFLNELFDLNTVNCRFPQKLQFFSIWTRILKVREIFVSLGFYLRNFSFFCINF